jgi:hypothetical protein
MSAVTVWRREVFKARVFSVGADILRLPISILTSNGQLLIGNREMSAPALLADDRRRTLARLGVDDAKERA